MFTHGILSTILRAPKGNLIEIETFNVRKRVCATTTTV